MHDSKLIQESDGISQRPNVQEHLQVIERLKSIKKHYVNMSVLEMYALDYAISFLELPQDDLK